jgi:MoaA/NifB/PqqE/SkfB family radical SAM enzyme
MDIELYKTIIDEIAEVAPNTRVWMIYFGDPFLCKDMPERIQYAKHKGLSDVVLNTNGVGMTPERSAAVIDAGLDAMYVGIDALTETTYDKIRVGSNFERVRLNVLSYANMVHDTDQQVYVQFVESKINRHELEEFKTLWTELGIEVKVRTMLSWAGLVEASNQRDLPRQPCRWNTQSISICSDGILAWCAVDLHQRMPAGDVNEESLVDLWQYGALATAREQQQEGRYDRLPRICQACSDWQSGIGTYVD